MKKCTYCGKEYTDEAEVCPRDGEPLVDPNAPKPSTVSPVVHLTAIPNEPKVCPKCGNTKSELVVRVLLKGLIFYCDRRCKSCKTTWTPPISKATATANMVLSVMLLIFAIVMFFAVGLSSPQGFISIPAALIFAAGVKFLFCFMASRRVQDEVGK